VANTTLAAERSGIGEGSEATSGISAGRKAGMLERRAGDLVEGRRERSGTAAAMSGRLADRLFTLARERGLDLDPVTRQSLAQLWTLEQISSYMAQRAKGAAQAGRTGPPASLQKLHMSRILRLAREVGLSILGPDGTLVGPDSASGGVVQEFALFSPAPSIYGGTDEIQRNLVGERVLGLPREPRP
jgi:alkylation response protein AidB-like acyl-CoA dehydrogenase